MTPTPHSPEHVEVQRGHIFHAEDSQTILVLVARFLRAKGYQVESAVNGKEALTRILAQPAAHDLVIMDYVMPELNGLECVKALRENGFVGRIIVFADTLPDGVDQQFLALGVSRILYKSSDFGSLDHVINDLLHPLEAK
jgi:CheY-like chemotaxis protein